MVAGGITDSRLCATMPVWPARDLTVKVTDANGNGRVHRRDRTSMATRTLIRFTRHGAGIGDSTYALNSMTANLDGKGDARNILELSSEAAGRGDARHPYLARSCNPAVVNASRRIC